ncbi:MAG TPA: Gfo/Idh/MocA family oxidoreductase, partial [Microlunatus sp.]
MSIPQRPDRRRVALVGAGVIGRHHGQVLTQLGDRLELVAVVDPHPERAQQIVDSHGGKAYPSLAETLAGTDVDIVVVCTPTG